MNNLATPMTFTEEHFEEAVLELLEQMGYTRAYGPEIVRDYRSPYHAEVLRSQLSALNPTIPADALDEAYRKIRFPEHGTLVQQNRAFHNWLTSGIEITYQLNGKSTTDIVRIIDYDSPANNTFEAINQWTVVEFETKRPDIVIFVNGLPLVVIELKSCGREETDASEGYRQIRNYLFEIPSLFIPNVFCIISDHTTSKAGTITANEERFMEWKSIDGTRGETVHVPWDILFRSMLDPARLLELVADFTTFSSSTDGDAKILAAYHQYFAVKKAVASTLQATRSDGKGGVFWHTQGSGKSLSMVFYARALQRALQSPTIVVITDRNDLDNQLFSQFSACAEFLRQTPVQATSRVHLRELLNGRKANGIFFTTMQKFEETSDSLSERSNIIVIADEAHRSQYGLSEKVRKDGSIAVGSARIIRDSLPNATYIGFTGTPIAAKDRNTREVFGDYIDVYDMTQAVDDGATRPVYYESRVINLGLDAGVLAQIDAKYDLLSLQADARDIERSKKDLGTLDAILGAKKTIDALCRDISTHYEDGRAQLLTGKAMIVVYSRATAMKIYSRLLELRPDWANTVNVVMTSRNDDPEEWRSIIGNKTRKRELAAQFKDDKSDFKIAIVVDMWLTGFDVPSLATMYVYKPMDGHNLMQAIARVNRVFSSKEGGLVVDYVGIIRALKQAMNDYTVRDRSNYGDMDVARTALPRFLEKLEVCRDCLHGFDYSAFTAGDRSDLERAGAISGGIDFLLGKDECLRDSFMGECGAMLQAQTLCQTHIEQSLRLEAAFFSAVRVGLLRLRSSAPFSLRDINEQVSHLLEQSIKSDGVINLFADADEQFSIFDPAFLAEIATMKEQNLAAELLKKLLGEQISQFKRTNIVKAEKFSERLARLMNSYRNGQLTNAEVIDELRKMATEIASAHALGDELGLSPEELAFYDALTRPEAVRDFYSDDQLCALTHELTDILRGNRTIDWKLKESARANMRMLVKRLLKKYNYPPEEWDGAVATVIAQCEQWADGENRYEVEL